MSVCLSVAGSDALSSCSILHVIVDAVVASNSAADRVTSATAAGGASRARTADSLGGTALQPDNNTQSVNEHAPFPM